MTRQLEISRSVVRTGSGPAAPQVGDDCSGPALRQVSTYFGLQELFIGGDIILSVGGMTVSPNMTAEFREVISKGGARGEISVTVLREGQVIVFDAPL